MLLKVRRVRDLEHSARRVLSVSLSQHPARLMVLGTLRSAIGEEFSCLYVTVPALLQEVRVSDLAELKREREGTEGYSASIAAEEAILAEFEVRRSIGGV